MLKRVLDILLALVLLVLSALPMSLIAITILVSTGRPVLFRQIRPGYQGKLFSIMKFRTMNNNRGPEGELLTDEERLTKLGKVLRRRSLDELPQLLNVFKGELSFVGPRPLLTEYLPLYNKHQARRHEVKPGITGWAQVNGRNAITWEEKFDLDVWYVDHRSLSLDMKILWLTFVKVLKSEGISAKGCVTMPEFKGSGRYKEGHSE